MKHVNFLLLLPLALVFTSTNASATHKSWLLQDAGTACQSQWSNYDADIRYAAGSVYNVSSSSRSVVCPVTLAGRFGASSSPGWGSYVMTQSMKARDGDVFVYDASSTSDVSCFAQALGQNGTMYYSRTVSSTSTGAQTLEVFDTPNLTWGGVMTNQNVAIRAIGYRCSLPQYSYVYGYMVNLCQISSSTCAS